MFTSRPSHGCRLYVLQCGNKSTQDELKRRDKVFCKSLPLFHSRLINEASARYARSFFANVIVGHAQSLRHL